MKTKILLLIIFAFFANNLFAQKVYVPSVQKYATIVDYIDDTQKDLSKYSGDYLFIYPGYDQKENSEGDAYLIQLELRISNDGKYVTGVQTLQIPEKEAVKTTNLSNPSVFGNTFSSDELTGKFIVLKYKKKGVTFSAKGILKKHMKDSGYDFYEKTK
jgi:hypothetical protein